MHVSRSNFIGDDKRRQMIEAEAEAKDRCVYTPFESCYFLDRKVFIGRCMTEWVIRDGLRRKFESWLGQKLMMSAGSSPIYHLTPSLYTSFCGVPKALYSKSYTRRHVHYASQYTLVFSLSLKHRLYADDTQIFFSSHPPNSDSSIAHFQNALQQVSSWTTANILTVNSFKTEFLLIGLIKATCRNTWLLTQHRHPLCLQPWFHLWWIPQLFSPNFKLIQLKIEP